MGKRELLIITAFVVMGVAAYQLAAAPTADRRRRFSLATLMDHFREETTGRRASTSVTTEGTIALVPPVGEVRVSSVTKVTIQGADRRDVGYTLTVEASGPDEAAARRQAERTLLTQDLIGSVLSLRANAPREGRQVVSLVLNVPRTLRLRVESAGGGSSLDASDVADLQLDAVGDVRLSAITGSVTGAHRNGTLSVADAAAIDLTLQNSESSIERTTGVTKLSTRNGHHRITGAGGPVDVVMQNDEVALIRPAREVRVTGTGGSLAIEAPEASVHVDTRRTSVDVVYGRAVPLTILTTDEPLHLLLAGTPSFALDAIATDGGRIVAESLGVAPEKINDETRLAHTVNTGCVPVALRNRRGEIVIGEAK